MLSSKYANERWQDWPRYAGEAVALKTRDGAENYQKTNFRILNDTIDDMELQGGGGGSCDRETQNQQDIVG